MNLLFIINHQLNRSEEARENKKAYSRAKRKAKKLGIEIQIDGGYWLIGTGWDDDNYCSSWIEVDEKLTALEVS